MTWQYDLQRRANLIFAQLTSADYRSVQLRDFVPDEAVVAPPESGHLARRPQDTLEDAPPCWSRLGDCDELHLSGAARPRGLSIQVIVRMQEIPTSFVHLLEAKIAPLVTFRVTNHDPAPVQLKLVSRVEEFSAEMIETIELRGMQTIERSHLPVFLVDRIACVTETRAASLYVKVVNLETDKTVREESHRIMLLPRTTAYLSVTDASGGEIDVSRYLGAWVTPNAPEVMQVIREAAALHPSKAIVGYQPPHSEDLPRIVALQVEAIYKALQARKLAYVSSVTAFSKAGSAFVQRIRLPRESLATASANCIDAVVLMASVLEAASLNPAIVLIPNHAIVAYEQVQHSGNWDYLETALIGSAPFRDARDTGRRVARSFNDRGSSRLRMLELRKLRTEYGVYPME